MSPLVLQPLESLLNYYLHLDEDTLLRLKRLSQKIFKLDIEDWNIIFFIFVTEDGILLKTTSDSVPTTTIRGRLNGILKLCLAKGSNTALFENQIQIEGDLHAGEALRHLLAELDVDWEEQLSKLVGDATSHTIGTMVRHAQKTLKKTGDTLSLNFKEFLQLELKLLPSRKEVHQFITNVTTLRYDVDRSEARIHRLQRKRIEGV